ncbi:MAG: 2,3-bisphosphoglycerate-independent phosphoglycerate mutase [Bacteroidia bacterium]|nr:2,3-bisphosphoglycerate-independent phosphoglycerate mutase [Bacteroidia bacterium]MCZ2276722.1 2,3-bisphosphoglycerate-independent phosphoglycerate mutase [Bacteroidia bacterium]
MNKKVVLMILDGWGIAPFSAVNAIVPENAPFVFNLLNKYPNCQLVTSGEHVGLPEGQMGNSEVGHLNIGAGRIVYQELALINKAVRERTIDLNPVLNQTFDYAVKNHKALHLIGLVSDGGVHSHAQHLVHLCRLAAEKGLKKIFIHAFTDGRDTDPHSGINFLKTVIDKTTGTGAKVASVIGRYYAMDRDKRWERIKVAYDLLTNGNGEAFEDVLAAVNASYKKGVTDEFIKPVTIVEHSRPVAVIQPGDAVICFNFRTDRCREITHVLTQENMPEFTMHKLPLHFVTMTRYDNTFKNVEVIFEKADLTNTLGEVLANSGKRQLRMAETEKYPHVTFFFSGGREKEFIGEKRILIASPKVATYDLQPEMSAVQVKQMLIEEIRKSEHDFICVNFANPDMVGHTGVPQAIIQAVKTVDSCVNEIVEEGLKHDYFFLITADHGNAEKMKNEDGSPNTAHTTNPVPCIYVSNDLQRVHIKNGILADLAPTILKLMGIAIPAEMTGNSLIIT